MKSKPQKVLRQKVLRLKITDFLGIEIAELVVPEGAPLVEVSSNGKNGQGKSSLIKGLEFLLQGKKVLDIKPVREGANKATVVAETTDFIIEATVNKAKSVTYRITAKDTGMYQNNRQIIDELMGKTSIDPVEFSNMSSLEQFRSLMEVTPLDVDVDELNKKRKGFYDERTFVSRTLKGITGSINNAENPDPDLPKVEIDVNDLLAELKVEEDKQVRIDNVQSDIDSYCDAFEDSKQEQSELEQSLKDLQQQISNKKTELENIQSDWDKAEEAIQSLPDSNPDPIKERLTSLSDTNQKIRDARDYDELAKNLSSANAEYEKLSKEINGIDNQKAQSLQRAKFPVEGLSVDLDNKVVTYNDPDTEFGAMPFSQVNDANKLMVSAMIQLSSHPNMQVCIFKGASVIGKGIRAKIEQHAIKEGYLAIFESLNKSEIPGIVIESGIVVDVVE